MKSEKLGTATAVKGTMLQAHLAWAREALGEDGLARALATLPAEDAALVGRGVLATDWVPFATLVRLDRAIATAVGGPAEATYREMGRQSARANLAGAYKAFMHDELHRFFENIGRLHSRFQNFGQCTYEHTGERSCRLRYDGYENYSPVFCASAVGYFEGALEAMRAPRPSVREPSCQCAGDASCVFDLAW
ncbi:MAG TPA: DUF2378 family protein [Vicinamibacteria bacterium]|nr:DUF2378 family protein [Vicinamibacteria bacterium]